MSRKGFEANLFIEETPNLEERAEKPLKTQERRIKKVDINELKARAQRIQNKENKKNISIFVFFLILVSAAGIYLSI